MLNVCKGRSCSRGMSLVELMVVVTILGIMAMLGLPAFTTWIRDTQIRTAAEGVLSGMQLARVEAVRRNRDVEFVLTAPGTPGGTGWRVRLVGAIDDIQLRPDAEGSRNVTFTVAPEDATRLTFNSFGRISTGASDLARVDVGSGSGRALSITTGDGQPRMCDPAVTVAQDPRICPPAT